MDSITKNPCEYLEWLLEFVGLTVKPTKKKSLRFRFINLLVFFGVVQAFVATVIYFIEDHPLFEYGETAQCFFSLIHLTGKIFNIMFRSDLLWSIVAETKDIWAEMIEDEGNYEILKEVLIDQARWTKLITVLFLLVSPLFFLMTFIKNWMVGSNNREMPFQLWEPWKLILGEEWYWLRSITLQLVIGIGCIGFAIVFPVLHEPCNMAAGQMRVLSRMLDSQDVDVKKCVRFHQKIVKYVRKLNDFFGFQLALEIFLSALQITGRVIQLIYMFNHNDPRMIGVILFLILCYGGPFLCCFCGQNIENRSEELYRSAVHNNWYRLPIKDKKNLYMLVLQASQGLRLDYKHHIIFNMTRFAGVCQATYSCITVMTG